MVSEKVIDTNSPLEICDYMYSKMNSKIVNTKKTD